MCPHVCFRHVYNICLNKIAWAIKILILGAGKITGFVSVEISFELCVSEALGCLGNIAARLNNTSVHRSLGSEVYYYYY